MLFAQGIYEMGCLLDLMGGSRSSLHWLPGPGDLFVTVFGGRTIKLGRLLGQGVPYSEARQILAGVTLESVEIIDRLARSLTRLERRGLARRNDFPLLFNLNDIIHGAAAVDIPWDKFFGKSYA
jgi:glycerol-3-phosphate dehydrogenase (NAD(P)+)